jgi:hypothetical protein
MKECKDIRNEIDQTTFADQPTDRVREHLRACADCSRFEAEQKALQGMMASLGTISAPADFDFRLRARLAREKSAAGNGGGFATFLSLLRLPRALGVAALVLMLAAGGVLIKNWLSARGGSEITAGNNQVPAPPGPTVGTKASTSGKPAPAPVESSATTASTPAGGSRIEPPPPSKGVHNTTLASRKTERRATREEALTPAAVLMSGQSDMEIGDGIVRVPLDDEGLKITIEDGRGSPRTISLPRFSFGSQRLTGQSFVPVSSKGVW